eukprot:18332-Heterococcus_DN1.PRE.1
MHKLLALSPDSNANCTQRQVATKKLVVVTGASSGLGKGCVKALAASHAQSLRLSTSTATPCNLHKTLTYNVCAVRDPEKMQRVA